MIITSITKQKKSNRYNIFVDNEYAFSASLNDLLEFNLKENAYFEENDLKLLEHKCQFKQAYDKSIRMLSIRVRSQDEIRKKLLSYNFCMYVIDQVLERLIELNYINDMEFSRQYIQDRVILRMSGKNKIVSELKRKGIDIETIESALTQSQIDDLEIAVQVIDKKLRVTKSGLDDIITRQKIYRHLIYKGFTHEISKLAINTFVKQQGAKIED